MDYSRKNPQSSSRGHVGGGIKGSGNPDGREGGGGSEPNNKPSGVTFVHFFIASIDMF